MDLKVPEIKARELLLHPMNLLHQVYTALLPGILVVFLLMLKHRPVVAHFLSATTMLGYKSQIVLGLFIAFVIGKVVQSAAVIFAKSLTPLATRIKNKQATEAAAKSGTAEPKPVTLTADQESTRSFFTAMLMGTVLARDGSAFDSWEAKRAHLGLAISCGFVLMAGCCFPGDGLRVPEFLGGLLLFASALAEGRNLQTVKIEAIGGAVGQVIASHTVSENTEILKAAAKVLPIITKHINPSASEQKPVDIVTEIAESTSPGIAAPRPAQAQPTYSPNRRERRRKNRS